MPTFGSLFAGIGGIDLGLERAGWTGRWQVEWDDYCQRVLAKHWPDIPRYGDITTVDWSGVEPVDLIAGGFPCQPFSLAGQRRGKADDRWLWPAFAAAIRALRPRCVLVENVPGLLAGHGGMGAVLGDLAELGYDAEWDCIPAAAVGAPHLRYRVWIVAHRQGDASRPDSDGERSHRTSFDIFRGFELRDEQDGDPRSVGPSMADTHDAGPQGHGDAVSAEWEGPTGHGWARGPAGGSDWWATEPDVGRVAHGVPSRVDRLRSLGNAVVPQVVEVIGRRLLEVSESPN